MALSGEEHSLIGATTACTWKMEKRNLERLMKFVYESRDWDTFILGRWKMAAIDANRISVPLPPVSLHECLLGGERVWEEVSRSAGLWAPSGEQ
jgi:hypothetical protein